jgi:peroxiredoxin
MSQAESSGPTIAPAQCYPDRGHLLRDFVLTSSEGEPTQISNYRGRGNLVVVLASELEGGDLTEMAQRHAEFLEEEAKVVAIFQCPWKQAKLIQHRLELPFLVLADEDGRVYRSLGALTLEGKLAPAVYVTDRFGEVFAAYRTADGQRVPSTDEMLGWLRFINRQCPECFPSEWPAQ